MKSKPFKSSFSKLLLFLISLLLGCRAQALDVRTGDPYYSAVVLDARTGNILFEDHAAAIGYPASMIKLMNLFVVLAALDAGTVRMDDPVKITRAAEEIGGRQVWLKTGEVFSLEELIYAMMVHSANDAATAVAIHVSGSKAAHAEAMNAKARALGLDSVQFHNVHGLPPGAGQLPDTASALDMARWARALLMQHPEALQYTSVSMRDFREKDPVKLTSSNKLLKTFEGCDGLKTGYFRAGGFSITVTAKRNGRRVIAVLMGCKSSETRNQRAEKLMENGFLAVDP